MASIIWCDNPRDRPSGKKTVQNEARPSARSQRVPISSRCVPISATGATPIELCDAATRRKRAEKFKKPCRIAWATLMLARHLPPQRPRALNYKYGQLLDNRRHLQCWRVTVNRQLCTQNSDV